MLVCVCVLARVCACVHVRCTDLCMWSQVLRIPIKSSEVPIIRGHDGSNIADIQSSAGVLGMVIEPVRYYVLLSGLLSCADIVRHSSAIYGQLLLFCDQSMREKAWRSRKRGV